MFSAPDSFSSRKKFQPRANNSLHKIFQISRQSDPKASEKMKQIYGNIYDGAACFASRPPTIKIIEMGARHRGPGPIIHP